MTRTLKHQDERVTLILTMIIGGFWGLTAIAINLLSLNLGRFEQFVQKSSIWYVIGFPSDLSSAFIFLPISLIQPLYVPGSYLGTWHIIVVNVLTFAIGILIGWSIGKLYIKLRKLMSQ